MCHRPGWIVPGPVRLEPSKKQRGDVAANAPASDVAPKPRARPARARSRRAYDTGRAGCGFTMNSPSFMLVNTTMPLLKNG